MFKFQFKYSNCSGTTPGLSYAYNGSTFRAGWFNTDFLLMELNNSPIGNNQISWAGWDRSANIPDSGAGIHHPAGDVMKISLDNNQFQTSSWNGVNNHWLLSYDDGVVQHGSSGSPIFNQNNRIVGQLHGNQNYNETQTYCNQPSAEYGMLSVSWAGGGTNETRLSNWLDPCNSGNITTNTSRPPSIVGPDLVCSSGTSFSFNNLPTGANITWTNSTILSRISAQDSNPGIFSANGQGKGWLEAEIALPNGCGNNIIVRKDVWTGSPNEVTKLSHVSFGCTMGEIIAKPALGAEQYEWQVFNAIIVNPYSGTSYTGEEGSIFVDPSDNVNSFTIKIRALNSCGTSDWYTKTIPMDCSGGPTPLSTAPEVENDATETIVAYPNPANDQITVIVRGDYEYTGTRPTGIHAIRVLDQNSIERQYYTFKQNKTVQTIDISYLSPGLNFLLIYTDIGIVTKKILVR
ncbi:T9SS type A sorting domain-containing protein [Gillisia sp. Q332]|uniref:T9SS type A sorting domain-containing protein n=1 Tax=Gillisia xinjiangensis TaxID=3384765 RepID=UPI00391D6A8A